MANINIRLNKNFTTQYNKMQSEYGEEFARLNGFADEQLSYTDFIDNFIDEETVENSFSDNAPSASSEYSSNLGGNNSNLGANASSGYSNIDVNILL